jgi:hypothetical protein
VRRAHRLVVAAALSSATMSPSRTGGIG